MAWKLEWAPLPMGMAMKAPDPPGLSLQRPAPESVQELADGFTYAFNRYQTGGHQARKPVQSRSESSSEDILEVLARGPDYTTYRVRVQVHRANDAGQCQSECAAELTLNLLEACRIRALQEGTLEKKVVSMVPAFPSGKISHITTFMSIHPAFSRTQQILDQLFARCCPPSIRYDAIQVFSTSGNMQSYNNQGDTLQDQLKRAVASVTGAWPGQIQYVGQPLLLPWFTLKQALVQGHLPASHPLGHVLSLWVELEHLEPTEAELEAAPEAPPKPARCPAADHPPAGTTKHLIKEEKHNILTFPPILVAEQLTVMDAVSSGALGRVGGGGTGLPSALSCPELPVLIQTLVIWIQIAAPPLTIHGS
ncbi:ral guanine nucleotide dissociation stimulator-like [Molossus molossus]|uniref:ral guanine nucleotide dissociation stimulator-like n=1 Tax=Molossus molossus TaxID=27622 RepID=UPI0017473A68|nr:ral guanine nucleotide dissociation stimulator-like [Molossus molossus]